jgi:hypothetical protein
MIIIDSINSRIFLYDINKIGHLLKFLICYYYICGDATTYEHILADMMVSAELLIMIESSCRIKGFLVELWNKTKELLKHNYRGDLHTCRNSMRK